MTFGSILFLYALPLAGLPIVFHLLMKRKRQPIEFSTFMFFLRSDPNLASKRRLKEILLLLLRMLFIVFILLALSRPVISQRWGTHGPTAVAIVIDNSASMTARGTHGETKLKTAITAACDLVGSLEPGSMVSLALLVEDPSIELPPGLAAGRTEILDALTSIRATAASGNPEATLRRAFIALEQSRGGTGLPGAIHLFSDLQKTEWESGPMDIAGLSPSIGLFLHSIPTPTVQCPNALIESVTLPERHVLPGYSYPVTIAVRNESDLPLNLRLKTEDNLRNSATHSLAVRAHGVEAVTVEIRAVKPGIQWLDCRIEGDAFAADNRTCVGIICDPPARVLFAGIPSEFGLLPAAVSPAGDGKYTSMTPVFCPAEEITRQLAAARPLMVVITWDKFASPRSAHMSDSLQTYVREGGNLLVVPSPVPGVPPRPRFPWIEARPVERVEDADGLVLDVLDRRSDLWGALRDASGRARIRHFKAERFNTLSVSRNYSAILGRGFAQPVIAEQRLGDGYVYVSGVVFAPSWCSLANDPTGAGMLLVHNMALRSASGAGGRRAIELTAGLPMQLPADADSTVSLMSLAGDPMKLTVVPGDTPVLPRTGVFSLRTYSREHCVWVRPSDKEGTRDFIEESELAIFQGLPHSVRDISPDTGVISRISAVAGVPLFFPFLLLAMVAWMAESWTETAGRVRETRSVETGGES